MPEGGNKQIWVNFCAGLRLENPQIVWDDLIKRYSEPHRHYHTWQHVLDGLAELEEVRFLAQHPDEIRLAYYFHDAVYDPKDKDSANVDRSADLAVDVMSKAKLPKDVIARVKDLILATKHDVPPVGIDAELITDIDLAILGKSEKEFDEYEAKIRLEYAFVEEKAFKEGRRKVLEKFLARPSIFSTNYFFKKYESQARANLKRSILRLSLSEVRE